MDKRRIREIKRIVQRTLSLYNGEEYPVNPLRVSQKLHIPVCSYADLSEKVFAMNPELDEKVSKIILHNGQRAIFYDAQHSRANFILAHELGHYLLEHEKDSPMEEEEAELFAFLLLYPDAESKWNKPVIGILAVTTVILLLVCWTLVIRSWPQKGQEIDPASPTVETTEPSTDTPTTSPYIADLNLEDVVYTDDKGLTFHRDYCIYKRQAKNPLSMTIQRAIELDFMLPCTFCFETEEQEAYRHAMADYQKNM